MGKTKNKLVEFQNEVARLIRAKRRELDLTQEKAGELAGVHLQTICRYERGKTEISLPVLFKLAEVYGVDVREFIPSTLVSA
jgi:transcriptional regulator with XRE-family HTH domain